MAGHKILAKVDTRDRCVLVNCCECRFRTSAETIEQAARAQIAHIRDTES